MKDAFRGSHISWVTSREAAPLLLHNELIDEVLEYNFETFARLFVEQFDIIVNPSNDKASSIIAAIARSKKKYGFVYNKKGFIEPLGKMANYYLEMAIDDDRKRKNTLTYPAIVSGMIGIDASITILSPTSAFK